MAAAPAVSYTPAPHEAQYYEGLFLTADLNRQGNINGSEAVQFFGRSKLPVDTLRNIWTLADQPQSNSLDRRKFFVAIRLIELAQNGLKANDAQLSAPPGATLRPVYFEGVSGVTLPMPGAAGQQPQGAGAAAPPQQQPPQQQQQPPQQQQQLPPQQSPQLQPQQPPAPAVAGAPAAAGQQQLALAQSDPYTMYPHDQSAYEGLFPQYEVKKDGYVYGAEAVGLFSKSGLPQDTLRDIWNMVDNPVDNRLDKLEFAMAMHLIVCVSKKNLPMPSVLPYSLKQLKLQADQPQQQQQQMPPPATEGEAPPAPTAVGSGMPPPAGTMPPPATGSLPGPPPLEQQGGMNISDAFEGLSTVDSDQPSAVGGSTSFGTTPAADGPPPLPEQPIAMPSSIPEPAPATTSSIPEPIPTPAVETASAASSPVPQTNLPPPAVVPPPAPLAAAPPADTKQLAASYDMSSDQGIELDKLKVTLQKLQAENISLKAQLGSMSDEEKNIHKEIAATVHEISVLSDQLSELRTQVLSAKTSLVEATAQLHAAQDKKAGLQELVSETQATKEAIESATEVFNANKETVTNPPPEPDLFSWGDDAAPAPIPTQPEPAAVESLPPPSTQYEPAPAAAESMPPPSQPDPAVAPPQPAALPEPEPATPIPNYGVQPTAAVPPSPGESPYLFSGAPLGGQANNDALNTTMESYQENGIMGGALPGAGAAPYPTGGIAGPETTPNWAAGPAAPASAAPTAAASESLALPTLSPNEINDLKTKLRSAEEAANDAENTRLELAKQADILKREAQAAEDEAKQVEAKAHEKKKGFGKGGKKKKELKQAEQLMAAAAEKKRQYREAQQKADSAQSVAMEMKFETDKLREEAEKAELDAAAAASMADARKQEQQQQVPAAPAPVPPTSYQPEPVKMPTNAYDNGGSYGGGGFTGIPTPTASGAGDPAGTYEYGGMTMGNMGMGMQPPQNGNDDSLIPDPSPANDYSSFLPPPAANGGDPYANPFG